MIYRRRERKVKIDDIDYIFAFDNSSIAAFNELSNNAGIIKSVDKLAQYDDTTVLNFICACVRDPENVDIPLGTQLLERHDSLIVLLNLAPFVVKFVLEALPQAEDTDASKK